MKIKNIVNKIRYNLRKRFKPFNILKLDIENDYHEVDDMLFYTNKQLFIDFIELEQPFVPWDEKIDGERFTTIGLMQEHVDHPDLIEEKLRNQQILDLYIWFKITHPILRKKLVETYDRDIITGASNYYAASKKLYKMETEKLIELLSLREYYWT